MAAVFAVCAIWFALGLIVGLVIGAGIKWADRRTPVPPAEVEKVQRQVREWLA